MNFFFARDRNQSIESLEFEVDLKQINNFFLVYFGIPYVLFRQENDFSTLQAC